MTKMRSMISALPIAGVLLAGSANADVIRYDCRGDNPNLPELVSFKFDARTLDFELLEYAPAGLSSSEKIAGPTVEGGALEFTIEYYDEGYVEMRESHMVRFDNLEFFSAMNLYSEDGSLAGRGPLGEGSCTATLLEASDTSSGTNENDSVVDYYTQLQSIEGLELEYPLTKKNGKWVSVNMSWETDFPAIVDLKSGYIFFTDEGTGGGNFDTQIVLWRRSDGSPLIGIAEVSYDPPYPLLWRLRFFEQDQDSWLDTTDYVLPKIGVSSFLTDNMTLADLNAVHDIGSGITVELPRKGTSIKAYLVVKDIYVNAVCNGEDWFEPGDKAPYFRYCENVRGLANTLILLKWNKQEGRFTVASKARAENLPWSADSQ
jgi:hypothetical protein